MKRIAGRPLKTSEVLADFKKRFSFLVLLSLANSLLSSNVACWSAQSTKKASAPTASGANIETVYKRIAEMEQKFLGVTCPKDLLTDRLSRLEQKILGQSSSGSAKMRLDTLLFSADAGSIGKYDSSVAVPVVNAKTTAPNVVVQQINSMVPKDGQVVTKSDIAEYPPQAIVVTAEEISTLRAALQDSRKTNSFNDPDYKPTNSVPTIMGSNGREEPGKDLYTKAMAMNADIKSEKNKSNTVHDVLDLVYEAGKLGNHKALDSLFDQYVQAWGWTRLEIPEPLPTVEVYGEILLKHAQAGNNAAAYNLGRLFDKGYIGRSWDQRKETEQAISWHKKAASNNDSVACIALAGILSRGDSRAAEKIDAVQWYKRAAAFGNKKLAADGLQAMGRYAEAEKIYLDLFAKDPNEDYYLDLLRISDGNNSQRMKWSTKFILDGNTKKKASYLDYRWQAYKLTNHLDLAIKDLDTLVAMPECDPYYCLSAKVELQQKHGDSVGAWSTIDRICHGLKDDDELYKAKLRAVCALAVSLPDAATTGKAQCELLTQRLSKRLSAHHQDYTAMNARARLYEILGNVSAAQDDRRNAKDAILKERQLIEEGHFRGGLSE